MRKKLEVHTLRFGNEPWLQECAETLDAWCKKHDYELILWDNSHKLETPKLVQKKMLDCFIKGGNTHMLYVDADVYVHPNAPAYPCPDAFSIATDRWHAMHTESWREWAEENYGKDKRYAGWQYSNAGVWSTDTANAKKILTTFRKLKFIEKYQEQHWFNVAIVQSEVAVEQMPSSWNRYCRDFEPSHFFHLWGEKKMDNLAIIKKFGLLEAKPNDALRFCIQPKKLPKNDKVVELELISGGGLGNQMFEWAAAYNVARSLNLPFRWTRKPSRLRDFGLTAFGLGVNPARNEPYLVNRIGQGHRKLIEITKSRINTSSEKVCRVLCAFQAEDCFIDHADEIAAIFDLQPMDLPNPKGTTPVGIQVRRGDYLTHSRLNVTTPDYFTNGMKWMTERVKNPHFIVVSDDPKWCEEFFGYREDVSVMPPQNPIEGLRTLASCHHHVISNSTFGWWGAWLGERRHKGHVVTPEIWHTGGNTYGQWEPVPKRWNKVSIHPRGALAVTKPKITVVTPEHKQAIVYPWKADAERWHELRYSLRSVDRFFEDKDCPIYILGTAKPTWLIEGGRVKYVGAYTYQEALTKGIQLADKVLWMNDDIAFLKPTTWADCETTLYTKPIPPDFLKKADPQQNPWRAGVVKILQKLADEGITDQKVFSTHTPYVYRRVLATEILRKYGVWQKFPMEMAYFHHHAVNPTQITTEKAWGYPFGDAMFLNYADKVITEGLKRALRELFPDTPRWELIVNYGI